MRVLLAGDVHGQTPHMTYLLRVAREERCSRIVQVGDFGYWPHKSSFHQETDRAAAKAGIEVWWLDGNHENFDALEQAVNVDADTPQRMGDALWYLPRGCTWEWEGCRFMAFGGAYSIDKAHRVEGVSWWPQELITARQVERALRRGPVDVLLTHDAPEGACPIVTDGHKGDEVSRGNRLAVTAVMETVQARLLVHGHYHHRYYTRIGRTQIVGLDRDSQGAASWLVLDTETFAPRVPTETPT